MRSFWWPFFAFLCVILATVGFARPDLMDATLAFVGWYMTVVLWALFGLGIVTALGIFAMAWRERDQRSRRPIDGAYPLRTFRLRGGRHMIINPNHMASHALIVDTRSGAITDVEPGVGWQAYAPLRALIERTAAIRAIYPGDQARMSMHGAMSRMPSAAGAASVLKEPARPAAPSLIDVAPEPPAAPALTVADAMADSRADRFVLGQSDAGALAIFNPPLHGSVAIVGAPGTGKTKSLGFLLAALAVRQGFHVLILDPEGEWAPFASHCEHVTVESDTMPAVVDAIFAELNRRDPARRNVGLFVVIEEYGATIDGLRLSNPAAASEVETKLEIILRTGRKRAIGCALLDQVPARWPRQIVGACKWRAVFQLGPNQGAIMQEYHAHKLAPRGVFLHGGNRYRSVDTAPHVRQLLASMPAPSFDPVIDGVAVAAAAPVDSAGRDARWHDFTLAWFGRNPNYLGEPYGGISALAREMATADGRPEQWENYKSSAKAAFDAARAELNQAIGGMQ